MATLTAGSLIRKRSYTALPVENKRVLVRVDFNVPLDTGGKVTDDSRLRASLATIEYLIGKKAKIILMSHLGRPKGQVNLKYSLRPVAKALASLLRVPVAFAEDCIGPKAAAGVSSLKPGDVLLLENLRFHPEEESNDPGFGKQLASLADAFIQDAFGAVHRAHASTSAVASYLPSAAGALLEKEIKFLEAVRSAPAHPYLAILGGAKVSDKIGVVEAFISQVDSLFVGGAMAYTFLKANGIDVGDSLVEAGFVPVCSEILAKAEKRGITVLLPQDHLIVQDIDKPEGAKTTEGPAIPAGWKGVDVGPKTLASLGPVIDQAKTIFWNGPSGIFEVEAYGHGTMSVARMVAASAKRSHLVVVGGGDSVAAVAKAGVAADITYISTGGGASMEFLEGKDLPGVKVLPEA
jgi:phosphoglycerate kinase